jgi:hypothetical protein
MMGGSLRLRLFLVAFVTSVLWAVSPGARADQCVGDCDHDGSVVVSELVTGVSIALGDESLAQCAEFDVDGDNMVQVPELVAAVGAAMDGCLVEAETPSTTSPTPTPSREPDHAPCFATGCSRQLCEDSPAFSTCEYLPEYGCLRLARCGRDSATGLCSWFFDPGDDAHQCLLDLDACVFDQDCPIGFVCDRRPEFPPWSYCTPAD